MIKRLLYILSLTLCYSCLAQKKSDGNKDKFNSEEKEVYTADFYSVLTLPRINKSTFNLKEKITLNLTIINNGIKDFYIPEHLNNGGVNDELFIKVYKENDSNSFIEYKSPVPRGSTISGNKRKIFSIKNGQGYNYENIMLDFTNKISEPGVYKAEVYLDFSNLGYFKKIMTSTTTFKVIE